jgi:hypothetical protein
MPYSFLYGLTWLQELAFGLMKRRPVLTRYRLASSQRNVLYDSRKLAERLGWKPKVALAEALDRLVSSEQAKRRPTTASDIRPDSSRAA